MNEVTENPAERTKNKYYNIHKNTDYIMCACEIHNKKYTKVGEHIS